MNRELTIWIGGEGGEGVISIGEIISTVLIRTGLQVFSMRTYPAEIKGGLAIYKLTFGNDKIETVREKVDIAFCLSESAISECKQIANEQTLLILEKHLAATKHFPRISTIEVPFHELTKKHLSAIIYKSAVVVGYLAKLLNLSQSITEPALLEKFQGKRKQAEITEKNKTAFQLGWNECINSLENVPLPPISKSEDYLLLSGNQAMAIGAMKAHCEYVAGYPITPATPLLELLARELPKFEGTFIQTEDEIAALASCLGAAFAGKRALTATSGPGFALMSELINLSVMAELPVVIVNVQRAGPSTGMPTKTEQSDLLFALFGSPGESPRVVIAPANVKEAFLFMQIAFEVADFIQGPVIVLSDQSLGYRLETVEKRFFTQTITHPEISKSRKSIPGNNQPIILISGLEHNHTGQPDYTPDNHNKMLKWRQDKLNRIKDLPYFNCGVEDEGVVGGIGLVGWGSTYGVIASAKKFLSEILDQPVGHYHFRWINPLPKESFKNWVKKFTRVYFIEENYSGQLKFLVQSFVPFEASLIHKAKGIPFTESEIVQTILKMQEKPIGEYQTIRL